MDEIYPKRKQVRLPAYDYNLAGMYFLTICAVDKKPLFCQIIDGKVQNTAEVRLTRSGKIVKKYILSTDKIPLIHVLKYVIMPNHIHLLISVDQNDRDQKTNRSNMLIPQVISAIKRLCNKEIGENVFQRSYHDHVIRGKEDFEKIWLYIDDNPRRWKEDVFYVDA